MAEKTIPAKTENTFPESGEKTRSDVRYVAPPVDIYEEGEHLIVVADLPGVDKNAITVDVKGGILTLQGSPQSITPGNAIHSEFTLANYYRQFELAETVDIEKITADYKHGVLKLTLPKAEHAKPRRIEVQIAR